MYKIRASCSVDENGEVQLSGSVVLPGLQLRLTPLYAKQLCSVPLAKSLLDSMSSSYSLQVADTYVIPINFGIGLVGFNQLKLRRALVLWRQFAILSLSPLLPVDSNSFRPARRNFHGDCLRSDAHCFGFNDGLINTFVDLINSLHFTVAFLNSVDDV